MSSRVHKTSKKWEAQAGEILSPRDHERRVRNAMRNLDRQHLAHCVASQTDEVIHVAFNDSGELTFCGSEELGILLPVRLDDGRPICAACVSVIEQQKGTGV